MRSALQWESRGNWTLSLSGGLNIFRPWPAITLWEGGGWGNLAICQNWAQSSQSAWQQTTYVRQAVSEAEKFSAHGLRLRIQSPQGLCSLLAHKVGPPTTKHSTTQAPCCVNITASDPIHLHNCLSRHPIEALWQGIPRRPDLFSSPQNNSGSSNRFLSKCCLAIPLWDVKSGK
jgi:hypothetical protein